MFKFRYFDLFYNSNFTQNIIKTTMWILTLKYYDLCVVNLEDDSEQDEHY